MLDLDTWDVPAIADSPAPATPGPAALQIIECAQNTPEWHAARAGIPTASAFHKIITKGRADRPSAVRKKYMLELLGERLTGIPTDNFDTPATERGHYDEEFAAQNYVFRQNAQIETIGFMRRGNMGVSPDRRIIGQQGLVEIKSKKPDLQLAVLLADAMPSEHKPQVQGALMVSGYAFCDFVSYCKDLPLFVQRIERDEEYINYLREEIVQFNIELDDLEQKVINQYYGGINPGA